MTIGLICPEIVGAAHRPISFNKEPFLPPLPPSITNLIQLLPQQFIHPIPRYVAFISPFVLMWDYKWFQMQQISGAQVENLKEYRELQFIVLVMRFVPFMLLRVTRDANVVSWIAGFLGILSTVVSIPPYPIPSHPIVVA